MRACGQAVPLASGESRAVLQRALDAAQGQRGAGRDDEAAWTLRRAFDAVLDGHPPKIKTEVDIALCCASPFHSAVALRDPDRRSQQLIPSAVSS